MKFFKLCNLLHNRSLVGMDVNPGSIRLVEIKAEKNHCHIASYYSLDFSDALTDDEVFSAIRDSLKKMKVKTNHAAVALTSTKVITKRIQVDKAMNEKDLNGHIVLESEKYFAISADQLCWDFIISPSEALGKTKMEVQLVAAKKNSVKEKVDFFRRAGLIIKVIDFEPLALVRLANLFSLTDYILLHVTHDRLLIILVKQYHLIYLQEYYFDTLFDQQSHALINAVENQLNVVERMIESNNILLSGSYSSLLSIQQFLSTHDNWRVVLLNPFTIFGCLDFPEDFSSFVLVTGLALWKFQ